MTVSYSNPLHNKTRGLALGSKGSRVADAVIKASAFLDHVDHQRDAATTHDTAIDHEHQGPQGQLLQSDVRIR